MRLYFFLFLLISSHSFAAQLNPLTTKPLPVEEAFVMTVRQEGPLLYSFTWDIAAGYYLYKNMFIITDEQGTPLLPALSTNHQSHSDQFFGTQEIYHNYAFAQIQLAVATDLQVSYQGCWEQGLCYPVQKKRIILAELPQILSLENTSTMENSAYDFYLGTLSTAGIPLVLLLFFFAGLGLILTPCVLPMLPIISGTITGRQSDLGQRLPRALVFVVTMAATFSLFGLLSGFLGYRLQSWLGSPLALIILASLIVLLSLSMFGLLQFGFAGLTRFADRQLNLTPGSYKGAVLWGFLSPLILGSCLSAPLAAALIYLADRGNPLLGATALFLLALGMGAPLLLFVLGLGKLLPAGGPWLAKVKEFFAFTLLLLALFILSPLLPNALIAFLSGMVFALIPLRLFTHLAVRKALLASLLFGFITYGVSGWINHIFAAPEFQVVSRLDLLQREEQQALKQQKPAMVYYYADWCISCRELDWLVLRDEDVLATLGRLHLVKADVTRHNGESLRMLEHHQAIGTPTFIFIDSQGVIKEEFSLVGNINKKELLNRLDHLVHRNTL